MTILLHLYKKGKDILRSCTPQGAYQLHPPNHKPYFKKCFKTEWHVLYDCTAKKQKQIDTVFLSDTENKKKLKQD